MWLALTRLCAVALVAECAASGAAAAQSADQSVPGVSAADWSVDTTTTEEQRYGLVPKTFRIDLGGYLPFIGTDARLSTNLRTGTKVNLENVLGLINNTQTFNVGASWRISKHNFLAFSYFSFSRSGSKTISDSIVWGGNTYHAGTTLDVSNRIEYYGVQYRYYIWREPNWELGPGLGIDGLNVSSNIGIKVSGSGPNMGRADSAQARGSVTVPVPLLGVYGDWEFVPRVFVRGSFQYVYINDIEGYGGHAWDAVAGLEWFPFNHFGFGAVYHGIDLNVSKTSSRTGNSVNFTYSIQGPAIYLTATF